MKNAREAHQRLVTLVSRDVDTQGMRKIKGKGLSLAVGVGAGVEGELRELRQQLTAQHEEMMAVLERIARGAGRAVGGAAGSPGGL